MYTQKNNITISDNLLSNKGWLEIENKNEVEKCHKLITTLKDKTVDHVIKAIKKGLKNDTFNSFEYEQLLKATFRSVLRYSKESNNWQTSFIKALSDNYSTLPNLYYSQPYILFHLINDVSEAGGIHSDRIKECGLSYTCWTPINSQILNYIPISLYEGSHKLTGQALYRLINRCQLNKETSSFLLNNFSRNKTINLKTKKTESYVWNSDLLHIGNFNSGNIIHSALTFKLSNKPAYYEPSRIGSNLKKVNVNHENQDFDELLSFILKIVENIRQFSGQFCKPDKDLINFIEKFYKIKSKLTNTNIKSISFSLSLLAQRTEDNENARKYDLVSFLFGKENLVALERYLNYVKNTHGSLEIIDFLKKQTNFDSYQEKVLLSKIGYIKTPTRDIKIINENLLSW